MLQREEIGMNVTEDGLFTKKSGYWGYVGNPDDNIRCVTFLL